MKKTAESWSITFYNGKIILQTAFPLQTQKTMSPSTWSSEKSHPFQSILPDCCSIIFQYHIIQVFQSPLKDLTCDESKKKKYTLSFREINFISLYGSSFRFLFPYTSVKETLRVFLRRDFFCRSGARRKNSKSSSATYRTPHYIDVANSATLDNETFTLLTGCHEIDLSFTHHGKYTAEAFDALRGTKILHFAFAHNCLRNSSTWHAFESLHTLDISSCTFLGEEFFSHLKGIRELCINNMYQRAITNDCFVHLSSVEKLHMNSVTSSALTDEAFSHLSGGSLEELHMNSCEQFSSNAFKFLFPGKLKRLSMRHCSQESIDNTAFEYLVGLEWLDMGHCSQHTITSKAFKPLQGSLKEVKIAGCHQLSDKVYEYLVGVEQLHMGNSGLGVSIEQIERLIGGGLRVLSISGNQFSNIQSQEAFDRHMEGKINYWYTNDQSAVSF